MTNTNQTERNETMTHAELTRLIAREERRDKVEAELKKMKIGFCGVRHDCLVWRVSKSTWQVGHRSISLGNEGITAGAAAIFVSD